MANPTNDLPNPDLLRLAEKQQDRLDSYASGLETKASILVGIAGVITAQLGTAHPFNGGRLTGVILVVVAGAVGLAALWPQRFAGIDVRIVRVRTWGRPDFAAYEVLTQQLRTIERNDEAAKVKATLIRVGTALLLAGVVAGTIVANGGF